MTDRTGYQCKRCGQPAPMGVGYAVPGVKAYVRSVGVIRCHCGHSIHPDLHVTGYGDVHDIHRRTYPRGPNR